MAYNHITKSHGLTGYLDGMRIMEYKGRISQTDTLLNQPTQTDWLKNRDTLRAASDR
jgi:hypothetical protein